MNVCRCSPQCRALTKGKLAPGHDMKMIGYLKQRMEQGWWEDYTADDARCEALTRGAGAGLMARLEVTIRRGGFR